MNNTRLIDEDGVLQDAERRERLWAKGRFQDFDVHLIAVDRLTLNPENRRFRADREAVEAQLGRPLELPADEEMVIKLLLDRECRLEGDRLVCQRSKDTSALVNDWTKRGQERPLWIEPDGLVRNGNRRLAMIKRELADGGAERDHVEVIILDPAEFDDETLFEMEAREQLTEGLKVRYTEINLLLTLQEAADRHNVDWHSAKSISEVAEEIAPLVGNNAAYARVQLNAVKYMAAYLTHIGHPNEYGRLRGNVEVFRDVGKNMKWIEENDPGRRLEMLDLCFAAVTSGARYPSLRELRRLAGEEPDTFMALVQEVRDVRDTAPAEPAEPTTPPEAEDDDEELDEPEALSPVEATVADYPRQAVCRVIDLAAQMSRARRSAAPDLDLRLADDHLARVPPELLRELLEGPNGARVAQARERILAWADAVRDAEQPASEA